MTLIAHPFGAICLVHERQKVHDYFLLLLWVTEKHIFKIIIYFLVHQNVSQIISFEVFDGFI